MAAISTKLNLVHKHTGYGNSKCSEPLLISNYAIVTEFKIKKNDFSLLQKVKIQGTEFGTGENCQPSVFNHSD